MCVGVQEGRESGGEAVCLSLLGRPSERAYTPTPCHVSRINTRAARILCSSPNGAPLRNHARGWGGGTIRMRKEAGGGDSLLNPLSLFDESLKKTFVKGRNI